jgi:hypothetical protein
MLEKLFKLALLLVVAASLWIAWGVRDYGRYVYVRRADTPQDVLLDTRTGRIFT